MAERLRLASVVIALTFLITLQTRSARASPNVLFIAIDDLRPELGVYGFSQISSPNIDALARSGTLFRNSHCQMAVCSPSRASIMLGKRPDTTRVYDLTTYFRNTPGLSNVVTLPQYFKQRGYRTAGMGKIFHPGAASGNDNDAISWTEPYYVAPLKHRFENNSASWQEMNLPERMFPDARIAKTAASTIANLKSEKFFIAVGFHKPHLPFVFPPGYLGKYPAASISIASNARPPTNMPDIAWNSYVELRQYADISSLQIRRIPGNFMPDSKAKELRRAYWAATSFVDKQVGVVLNALTANGLDQNTTVVLWGDHGWQLGELGEWAKSTNFELSTRAPLIIRAPSIPSSAGKTVDRVVEHLDMYPTILELANFQASPSDGLQGQSLVPLLRDPMSMATRGVGYSQFTRNLVNQVPTAMGYTVRTADFRYTEWLPWNATTNTANWDSPLASELYDHRGDNGTSFTAFENANIVNDPAFASFLPDLKALLRNIVNTTSSNPPTSPSSSQASTTRQGMVSSQAGMASSQARVASSQAGTQGGTAAGHSSAETNKQQSIFLSVFAVLLGVLFF